MSINEKQFDETVWGDESKAKDVLKLSFEVCAIVGWMLFIYLFAFHLRAFQVDSYCMSRCSGKLRLDKTPCVSLCGNR